VIIPVQHLAFLKDILFSFWIGTASRDLIPEVIKCTGVLHNEAMPERLTCFAGTRHADQSLKNLQENPAITLVGAHVGTYEGYQYKGVLICSRPCLPAEVQLQEQYMESFTSALGKFGYSKEGLYKIYFAQPSMAFEFHVTEVYEQSPRKGTGGKIAL
jgi:hypothetical protein